MANKKDAYYFSHDSGARSDFKIKAIIKKYGWVSYAWYFVILEVMREQSNYGIPHDFLSLLSEDLKITEEEFSFFIDYCKEIGLFYSENGCLFSESFVKRMVKMDEKRAKYSLAGKVGMQSRWQNNNVNNVKNNDVINTKNNDVITSNNNKIKLNKSKLKEKKEKEIKKIKTIAPSEPQKQAVHVSFVESFQQFYLIKTGHQYNAQKKDFVLASNLIKKYGLESVRSKAKLLCELCINKSAWFTKEGMANFTIGKLNSHWNNILEGVKNGGKSVGFSESELDRIADEIKQ